MTEFATRMLAFADVGIDLEGAPLTAPGSRIIVQRIDDTLRVALAAYEQPLADCIVLEQLAVHDGDRQVALTRAGADRIEYETAVLSFDGPDALVIAATATCDIRFVVGAEPQRLPLAAGDGLRISVRPDRSTRIERAEAAVAIARTRAEWLEWFERCPVVRADLQPMVARCWWVLGANQVSIGDSGVMRRAVVPSKIGYVGLWQWDAYFIAVGLRHGALDVAIEQLQIAVQHALPSGQLPDVVHDEGVLASSDDLPEADRKTLRRAGSAIADPAAPIPLTKPPLTAWALTQLLEVSDAQGRDDAWARALLPAIVASQAWWSTQDVDRDGLPEYAHPYSSGLDDCPVFDGELPVATPDLLAYLALQAELLGGLLDRFELPGDADARADAVRWTGRLLRLWRAGRRRFAALGPGGWIEAHTIVDLLPVLAPALPGEVVDAIEVDIVDPQTFGTPWPLPTTAVTDNDFDPERMWRGPTWLNTNALVVAGLRTHGREAAARALAERSLAMVIEHGGPHEHWHPVEGRRAASATTSFAWSAALFIDLAVACSEQSESPEP